MKKAVYMAMCSLLCVFWTGCTQKDNQDKQAASADKPQEEYLFPFEEVEQFTLDKGGELLEFELNQANWELEDGGATLIEQEQVNDKITTLLKTAGVPAETFNSEKGTELFKVITAKDTVSFYKEHDDYYGITGQGTYKLSNFDVVSDFSPIYFNGGALLAEDTEALRRVNFSTATKEYFITKDKGTLSDVETTPFISGWYLHDYFKTPRSVEYYTMEQILKSAVLLPSHKINSVPSGSDMLSPISVVFEYDDGDDQQFSIVAYNEAVQSYFVEYQNSLYEVPKNVVSVFVKEGLQLVDRFLYILPLDAVTAVDIQRTKGEDYHLLIEHDVTQSGLTSTFFLNDRQVDEEAFRKMYQYIAVLAPVSEIAPSEDDLKAAVLSLKMTYTFLSEGESQTRTLLFYDTGEKNTYLCELGSKEYFSVSKQQLDDMLNEIQKLSDN